MADIFYSRDAVNLLLGKKVYFIGDSNMRVLYKDVVCLLVHNRLLTEKQLRAKAEKSFLGDTLLRGSALTKGRDFKEDRRYKFGNDFHIEFHFVTRCLNDDIKMMMRDIRNKKIKAPDVLVMNSTVWDITRWGPHGVEQFKDNMNILIRLFRSSLPSSTLVIWVTTPPPSNELRGGIMIKQLQFAQNSVRFHVMEANLFAHHLFTQNGYNVLDFHFHLRMQIHWRRPDGVHWSEKPMRHLTNLLLTHISLAWNVPLPQNFSCSLLAAHKAVALRDPQDQCADVKFPQIPRALLPSSSSQPESQRQSRSRGSELFHRRKEVDKSCRQAKPMGPPPPQSYQRLQQPPAKPLPTQDFSNDYVEDGPFINYSNQPQQIQSVWGPMRRNSRQTHYRHNPY